MTTGSQLHYQLHISNPTALWFWGARALFPAAVGA